MMCPADLEPYYKAHDLELDEKDTYICLASYRYGIDALNYAIDHILHGNKAKSKINSQSIREYMHEQEQANRPLTQEEIIKYTKEYFRQRQIDKINFDLMQKEKNKLRG